ncbi:MAG TPA: MlaD family protein, partial [Chthoniobacterales bacterium]|nr:MlaD family protein [Chthoniobacterales bacterium]
PSSTNIVYRGMNVGKVKDESLTKDGAAVKVSATIQDSASHFLTDGTVFWLQGANPSLSDLSSLGSILSGPTIVMQPEPGKSRRQFQGLTHRPVVPANAGRPQLFTVSFDGDVGDLSRGDAVKLRGFPVGEVRNIGFQYDARTGKISTPVTIALYSSLFHIRGHGVETVRGILDHLVAEGLRAQLDREPPLIGGYRVTLKMVPGAPQESIRVADGLPQIPTAPSGGLQSIVDKFRDVPIDQIAQNLLDITRHIDQIASSPQLKESVAQLAGTLRQVHKTVENVGPKIDQLVQSLRETAQQLDGAAAAAQKTMGGATSQTGLEETMREVKEAARAIRSMADYLDRHPEALIKGRSGG